MNVYDFDPDKVCLLDGYFLVKTADPNVDLGDLEACKRVMKELLTQVSFTPWANAGTSQSPWWLRIEKNKKFKGTFKFEHMLQNYALAILAPSGVIFKTMQRTDITAQFMVENKSYYMFADGMIVNATPSLDRRFLKNYLDDLEYFDVEDAH